MINMLRENITLSAVYVTLSLLNICIEAMYGLFSNQSPNDTTANSYPFAKVVRLVVAILKRSQSSRNLSRSSSQVEIIFLCLGSSLFLLCNICSCNVYIITEYSCNLDMLNKP